MTTPTGPLIAEYSQPSAFNARKRFTLWLILFVVSLGLFIVGAGNDNTQGPVIFLVAFVLFFIGLIAMIIDAGRSFGGKVMKIHKDGFILHFENGRVLAAYLWSEIKTGDLISNRNQGYYRSGGGLAGLAISLAADAAVSRMTIKNLRYLTLELRTADNKRFVVNYRFRHYVEMLEEMAKALRDALLPQALEFLKGGRSLQFGALTVTPTGLQNNRDSITWNEIDGVKFGGLSVNITKRDPNNQRSRNFARVPPALDRLVLMDVIQRMAPNAIMA